MANFVSYSADLTDPTFVTRDVDFNGYEVGLGPFETDPDTLDLGSPEMDGVWLNEAGKDEDVLSAHRRGRVVASFDLRVPQSANNSLANLTAKLRGLNAALDRSGVWVLQQPGASAPLYIDYYPSSLIQQLMPGSRSMFHLWTQLSQPNGMRVEIIRRPKMRGAALSADVNLAHNGTMAEPTNPWDGTPWGWTWDSLAGITGLDYDWTYGAHTALFTTASPRFLWQLVDPDVIEEGSTYTFAIDVARSGSLLPSLRARIDWYDAGAVFISTSLGPASTQVFSPSLYGNSTPWNRPAVAGAIAPAGAVSARYGLQVTPLNTSSVLLWTRDAQLQTGLAATDFRAGFETITQSPELPFYKRIWLKNAANADALGQLRALPSVDHEVTRMVYARRSGERDSAMAMRNMPGWLAAESTALQHGTTAVADGGRTVAKTALSDDVMRSILRHEMLFDEESAGRGVWRIRAALRGDLNDAYDLVGHYGIGDVADLPWLTRRMPVRVDLTGPPAEADYYVVDLGLVRLPPGSPGLFFELHGMRETTDDGDGTGELYVDQIWPEPADDDLYASVEVPGARRAGPVTESTIGRKLTTPPDTLVDDPDSGDPFIAGSVYNDDLLLNDTLEAAGLPAGMTDDLTPDVQHTFILNTTLFTQSEKVARKHGEFRIHDLTTDVQVKFVSIKNEPGVPWDEHPFTLRLIPETGHAYLVYAVMNVDASVGNIHMESIDHSFVPPVEGGTQTIAIDADQRRAYVLEDDQVKADLSLAPPFPTLMPKLQLLRVSFAGLASDGSDDVLDDAAALLHDPDLTARVGVHVLPRWFN